ncbi:MAG: tyrosine-protein phosphatase [Gemmataceae bacterium]|nr:tyrosine-protein phosphatase [Gemmataceae bacterium]MDW8263821.1 tyrosine-protein phosphatase [Gemmataceae bacterium]
MEADQTRGQPRRPPRWCWWAAVLWGSAFGATVAVGVEARYVLRGRNFHTVVAGKIYRSAQLTAPQLEEAIRQYGIRTVVNLRGVCDCFDWYREECRTTHRLNVAQEDLNFCAGRFPSMTELRRLVEVLDRSEYPILVHCRRGADRTGLAVTLALLLRTDATLEQAHRHLGPRYGHLPIGRSAHLDRLLKEYQEWLMTEQAEHSPERLRHWVCHEYRPYCCHLEMVHVPNPIRAFEPTCFRVRSHNTSNRTWQFRAGSTAGVHVVYCFGNWPGQRMKARRAGLFDGLVPPGGSIDLLLPLPALPPGSYSLFVDMIDEQHGTFFQMGSVPLHLEFEVQPTGGSQASQGGG